MTKFHINEKVLYLDIESLKPGKVITNTPDQGVREYDLPYSFVEKYPVSVLIDGEIMHFCEDGRMKYVDTFPRIFKIPENI